MQKDKFHSDYVKICRLCCEGIIFHGRDDYDKIPSPCKCNMPSYLMCLDDFILSERLYEKGGPPSVWPHERIHEKLIEDQK